MARRAEELGYRSLWTFQRLVVPEVPDERSGAPFYQQVQDAVVPLAFLAGQTRNPRTAEGAARLYAAMIGRPAPLGATATAPAGTGVQIAIAR